MLKLLLGIQRYYQIWIQLHEQFGEKDICRIFQLFECFLSNKPQVWNEKFNQNDRPDDWTLSEKSVKKEERYREDN